MWRNVKVVGDFGGYDVKDVGLQSGKMLKNLEMLEEIMQKILVCNLEKG